MNSTEKLELDNIVIDRIAPRILHITCKNVVIREEDLRAYLDAIGTHFGGEKFANLVEFGSFTNFTPEARKFSATEESNMYTLADAFVVKSLSQRILGNFYLKVDRPVVPTRLFSNSTDALKWLRTVV